jgi:hypothetical protein
MRVRFAEPSDRERLMRFDRRLREGGRTESMPRVHDPLVDRAELPVFRRLLVADDGEEVRAGMLLLHHRMYVDGEPRRCCFVQMPISEGLVNRAHSLAILQVVKHAMAYEPFLISLGVGSLDEAWARFVIAMKWRHAAVPFFFFPIRMNRVLRHLRYLQTKPMLGRVARVGALTGAGVLVGAPLNLYRRWRAGSRRAEVVRGFGDWADELFLRALPDYAMVAQRDRSALDLVYPMEEERFVRLRVEEAGWVVVSLVPMRDHRYFGDLVVGVIVDGFGPRDQVPALLGAAADYLASAGADLLVANWSHHAWVAASKVIGFIEGPSNYFAFVAPTAPSAPLDFSSMHLTRGDSDGMVNLRPPAS